MTHPDTVTLVDGYVPVIDLGLTAAPDPDRRLATAHAIRRACQLSGFFVIVGHGFAEETIDGLYRVAREFFRRPDSWKARVAIDPMDPLQRGFCAYDRLEKYCATRFGEPRLDGEQTEDTFGLVAPNRWPDLPGFQAAYLAYYRAAEALSGRLMRLLALALDLPEDWFADKLDNHMSLLAVNYYVPQAAPVPTDSLRTEAHSDFGTVTLLYQDDAPGGLQVLDPDGRWVDVPPLPGSFVVNLGKLMSIWTNDRLACTMHRVVNPPADQLHTDRISIPFFQQPNPAAVIECIPTCTGPDDPPRHPPTTSGMYFVARSRRLFLQRRFRDPDVPMDAL